MDISLVANTIRGLTMDAVQKANSGHPGMPMGTADFAASLFLNFLRHNPRNPAWADRDRYVQSAGHGSMLLYSLLHLCGYGITLEELQQFRQWGTRTPGHPEHGLTPGVETTTGPLGQGCGNAVGMALAEAMLAARFNRPGFELVNHRTYVLAGDGDLMEGISHEAFSLAGHLKLNKLIVFYDSNRITIEGAADLACSDNVRRRFEGYNWRVIEIDGHDHAAIAGALRKAQRSKDKPTLIIGRTHIARYAPHAQDTSESHGSPLGADEIKATKRAMGFPEDAAFYISDAVRAVIAERAPAWEQAEAAWNRKLARYRKQFPDLAAAWDVFHSADLPADIEKHLPVFDPAKPAATRKASGDTLQKLAEALPNLVGGSADLAPSNNTLLKNYPSVGPGQFAGRNLHFGIREHAMGAVLNGMALHGGFRGYGGTFLVFSDYFKPAIRLAAMMELPVTYVLTHDSIFLGEDGPTHQPVEQLPALRSIPNLTVIRPADPSETPYAWLAALRNRHGPTALILTRQNLPVLDRSQLPPPSELLKGGYMLWANDPQAIPEIILIATGSEVPLALDAARVLAREGRRVRVVNMPSCELFAQQPPEYREQVLPAACGRRLVIEAAAPLGWDRFAGPAGQVLGIERFGASAPPAVLAEKYGFTVSNIAARARELLG